MVKIEEFVASSSQNLENPYVCAGNRVVLIGTQDGLFPDFGHHIKDEMGGLWNHPIKLLDGFWLQIAESDQKIWLEKASKFNNFPFYNTHEYKINELNLEVARKQFCPDDLEGLIVTYTIENKSNVDKTINVAFLARANLIPVWFSEELGIEDGEDEGQLDATNGVFKAFDTQNPWFVVVGADRPYSNGKVDKNLFGPEKTAGMGITGLLNYENIRIRAKDSINIHFYIAGSYTSEEKAYLTLNRLKQDHSLLFKQKQKRYETILKQSHISIPDKQLETVFNWVKFHNDWLIREVPEIGRGLGAGHPEYSWWFGCDNCYALQGILAVGDFKLVTDTLNLLRDVSEKVNGNGRIVHEISTSGAVYNKGNTQETPHFIKTVWESFLWMGDLELLKTMYPTIQKGIEWLFGVMDPDGDLLPEGYGIIEIEGLNIELIDTATYTYEALRVAAEMANLLNDSVKSKEYMEIANRLKDKINKNFWLEEEGLYADAIAFPNKVGERIDTYIRRAEDSKAFKAVRELKNMKEKINQLNQEKEQPFLFKNWVINTPMEIGIAPKEKAIRALKRMGTDEFTGEWGTYLSGSYQTQMMTISTSVQAVAEAKYDRIDESINLIKLITSTMGKIVPGSISEMSPDSGCFVQAWTNYGISWPLITYIFGIQPRAYWKEVVLRPRLPRAWNELSIENVKLGNGKMANVLDFKIVRNETEMDYQFSFIEQGWNVVFNLPRIPNTTILLDGKVFTGSKVINDDIILTLTSTTKHHIKVVQS